MTQHGSQVGHPREPNMSWLGEQIGKSEEMISVDLLISTKTFIDHIDAYHNYCAHHQSHPKLVGQNKDPR